MIPTQSWYALHVKPRAELSVARQLEAKAYETLVPSYRLRRRWVDRVKEIEQPLFPAYVFCRTKPNAAGLMVTTPGVIRIVGAGNVPIAIDDAEIAALQRIVTTRLRVEPWPFLHVGERVELVAGPLRGLRGILLRFGNGNRLVVSVSLLQRSVSVEIGAEDVIPVEPALRCLRAAYSHT